MQYQQVVTPDPLKPSFSVIEIIRPKLTLNHRHGSAVHVNFRYPALFT